MTNLPYKVIENGTAITAAFFDQHIAMAFATTHSKTAGFVEVTTRRGRIAAFDRGQPTVEDTPEGKA